MSTEKQNGKVKKMSEKEEWKAYLKYVEASGRKKLPIIWKVKVMPQVYGWGAAVVLIGAFFKLVHLPFIPGVLANIMLGLGLGVEALIFIFSAFEKPHMEPNWSRIYPELNEDYCKLPAQGTSRTVISNASNGSAMGQFGSMPNISDYDRETLMESIKKLSENASQMAKIADAIKATDRYTEDMNEAAESARKLTSKLQISSDLKLNETMSNYINQVKDSQDLIKNLNGQVSTLKGHMENLNNVYGGMLNAMKIK